MGCGWRRQVTEGRAFGYIFCIWQVESLSLSLSLFISLCFLIIMWAASLHHTLLPWCSALPLASKNEDDFLWNKSSETVSPQINFSSPTIILVGLFVTAMRKLTKTLMNPQIWPLWSWKDFMKCSLMGSLWTMCVFIYLFPTQFIYVFIPFCVTDYYNR